MKYMLLQAHPAYGDSFSFSDLHSAIDMRVFRDEEYGKLGRRTHLNIKTKSKDALPDVLLYPFFMIKQKSYKIIQAYEPYLETRQFVLMDRQAGLIEIYRMPITESIDCLGESVLNKASNKVLEPQFHLQNTMSHALLRIQNLNPAHFICRLDMCESLCMRELSGVLYRDIVSF